MNIINDVNSKSVNEASAYIETPTDLLTATSLSQIIKSKSILSSLIPSNNSSISLTSTNNISNNNNSSNSSGNNQNRNLDMNYSLNELNSNIYSNQDFNDYYAKKRKLSSDVDSDASESYTTNK